MPRVKLQKPTEEERILSIADETRKIIRQAMIERGVEYMIDLAALIGMGNGTLSAKLKTGSWTQKDLCKLVSALHIPPEEAVRMIGGRLSQQMDKQMKVTLRDIGNRCLRSLSELTETALMDMDYRSAEIWRHEYAGAAKMLEALRIISSEDYHVLTEAFFNRCLATQYPEAIQREVG